MEIARTSENCSFSGRHLNLDNANLAPTLPYRELVGCLGWVCQVARPEDIARPVGVLQKHNGVPTTVALKQAAKKILSNLLGCWLPLQPRK